MSTGYKIVRGRLVAPGYSTLNAKGRLVRTPDFYPAGRSAGRSRPRRQKAGSESATHS